MLKFQGSNRLLGKVCRGVGLHIRQGSALEELINQNENSATLTWVVLLGNTKRVQRRKMLIG